MKKGVGASGLCDYSTSESGVGKRRKKRVKLKT